MNQKLDAACMAIQRQHQIAADYEKTLALLRSLKDGEISLAEVELLPDGWRLRQIELPEAIAARNGELPAPPENK